MSNERSHFRAIHGKVCSAEGLPAIKFRVRKVSVRFSLRKCSRTIIVKNIVDTNAVQRAEAKVRERTSEKCSVRV